MSNEKTEDGRTLVEITYRTSSSCAYRSSNGLQVLSGMKKHKRVFAFPPDVYAEYKSKLDSSIFVTAAKLIAVHPEYAQYEINGGNVNGHKKK